MNVALHATGALARRDVRLLLTPRFVTVVLVVPLVFFAGFAAVLHRLLGPVVDFAAFFPPAILVQVAMDSAITTAFFLAADRRDGIVARVRSLPVPALALPAARLVVDAGRFVVSAAVVTAAGYAIGFRFRGGIPATLTYLGLAVWFLVALAGFTAAAGLRGDDPETVSSNLYLPYLPLLTLSTAFVPLAAFPDAIEGVVSRSPVSVVVEALRHLAAGTASPSSLLPAVAWLAGLTVLGAAASAAAFRRAR